MLQGTAPGVLIGELYVTALLKRVSSDLKMEEILFWLRVDVIDAVSDMWTAIGHAPSGSC